MENIDNYQMLMANWASKTLMPHMDKVNAGEESEFVEKQIFNTIFTGFTEIMDTYEALEFSGDLLSVASPRSKKIAKEKYVVDTYLQDVYILKERLNTYATKIKRMHVKAGRRTLVATHIEPLFSHIKKSFQSIVDTRGAHVHAKRFTDENLTEAASLALIAHHSPEFSRHYDFSVRKIRVEWKDRIISNNKETLKLLDRYFGELIFIVADNGEVITP